MCCLFKILLQHAVGTVLPILQKNTLSPHFQSEFCPADEVAGSNDSGTNFHSDKTCSVSSHSTCNFLASFKHIFIVEGETKSIFCSWVNFPGQVWPPAESNQL